MAVPTVLLKSRSLAACLLALAVWAVAPVAGGAPLDVVLVPELSLGVLAEVVSGALSPAPDGPHEHLITCRVPRFELTVSEPMPVNLDGETMQGETFHFDVLKAHVPFCLPPAAPLC